MKRYLFNNDWKFSKSSGSSLGALMGPKQEYESITLPHDCLIGTERINDPTLASVAFYKSENVHYIKNFDIPEDYRGKSIWLEFEGIYQQAYIYINNAYVDQCMYGYGNYYIDITKFLKVGDNNLIKVVVKNDVNPGGRWYTGGGIFRDVHLLVGNALHIKCEGTRVSTEDIEDDQAVLRVVTPLEYAGVEVVDAVVVNEVIDVDGKVVARTEAPVTVFDHEKKDLRQRLIVTEPKLWDVDHPYLYTIKTTLYANGEESDTYESTFGIRKLQLDVNKGLRVNGKVVKLRGGCIHHDSGVIGTATFGNAEERRVRKLKEAGYNAIRSAHNPISKALLNACDKVGMYVMDEFTDVWTTTKAEFDYGMNFAMCWERDVTNWVLRDFNHPSVIMYSIGNEIPETGNKFDSDWGKKLADKVRELDDTRYVVNSVNIMLAAMGHIDEIAASFGVDVEENGGTMEINTLMSDLGEAMSMVTNHPIASAITEESFAQVDICGYNYAEDRYEPDKERYPDRIIVGSETTPGKLAKNWALVEKMPNVIGDFVWTAWDYLGEVGIDRPLYEGDTMSFMGGWPWRIAYCGTIDINGNRRPVSYWREIVWGLRKEPYIAVCPPARYNQKRILGMWGFTDATDCWNWPGYEGKPIAVEVYADADEVELFVNGKSVGSKRVGEEIPFFVKFDAVYEPGEVKAVSYKDGKSYEYVLRSAMGENILTVEAEQEEILANVEVGYVNIAITDKNGNRNPAQNEKIHVEVSGGVLLGLGSGDPKTNENYKDNSCTTFEGRALAIVRASEPGEIIVNVSAEGYETKSVTIKVK